ncbi:hypothetical protein ACWEWK_03085 [Streptomyces sp. NPDC003757]
MLEWIEDEVAVIRYGKDGIYRVRPPGGLVAACRTELEEEYVTAVDDDGELKFLPVVSERARAQMNQIADRKTRPPKRKTQPLAQLRVWWR